MPRKAIGTLRRIKKLVPWSTLTYIMLKFYDASVIVLKFGIIAMIMG